MKTSRCYWAPKGLSVLFQMLVLTSLGGVFSTALGVTNPPVLVSNSLNTRAVAYESVTMQPEPFAPTATIPFGVDNRTRVAIFAMNLDLLAGEAVSAFRADAEDSAHIRYPLNVEYVGQVPGFGGIYMVVVRLNDAMGDLGDVLVRLNLHGASTNRVRIAVGHVGGGPADDAGAVPTPA